MKNNILFKKKSYDSISLIKKNIRKKNFFLILVETIEAFFFLINLFQIYYLFN